MRWAPALLFFGALLATISTYQLEAYTHQPCTRSMAVQFSFPDCYLPAMNYELWLSEASFLMSHDAATGYLQPNHGVSSATNLYAKNQVGTVYDQLNDGARALDIRPKLLSNGTVICHHGAISIPVTLERLVADVLRWTMEHPDELVLIFHMHLAYESGMAASADTAVAALSSVYSALGVPYLACEDVYGLTVGEAMELALVSSGTGFILALDRHDAYANSCVKMNYVEDDMVTCYPSGNNTIPCTKENAPVLDDLKAYALASANNAVTDSSDTLGPPASLETYPFNAIQALWQVDTHAAAIGVAHVSSILDDNTKSRVNAHVVDWVYNDEFSAISLLMVDHLQLNGNALLSVLRNRCGQSILSSSSSSSSDDQNGATGTDDEDIELCGRVLAEPRLRHKPHSTMFFFVSCAIYLAFGVWLVVMLRHARKYNSDRDLQQPLQERLQQEVQTARAHVQQVWAGGERT